MKTQAEIDKMQEKMTELEKYKKTQGRLYKLLIGGILVATIAYQVFFFTKEPSLTDKSPQYIEQLEKVIDKQQGIISNAVNVVNGVEATNYAIKRNLVRFGELGEILVTGTTNLIAKSSEVPYSPSKDGTNFVEVIKALKGLDNRLTFWVGENFTNWTNIKAMLGENKQAIDSLKTYTLNAQSNNNAPRVTNVINEKVFRKEDMELAESLGYDLEGTIRKQIETAIGMEIEAGEGLGREELRIRLQRNCDRIIERSFKGFKVYEPPGRQ